MNRARAGLLGVAVCIAGPAQADAVMQGQAAWRVLPALYAQCAQHASRYRTPTGEGLPSCFATYLASHDETELCGIPLSPQAIYTDRESGAETLAACLPNILFGDMPVRVERARLQPKPAPAREADGPWQFSFTFEVQDDCAQAARLKVVLNATEDESSVLVVGRVPWDCVVQGHLASADMRETDALPVPD
ncbi:hypothetical protein Q9299_09490 [Gemmobacter fulvus]|uniref:hypothetical protein n=1 Tax=Gemmobacter fulvus TaxID=2840474 RepID=UPI00279687B0|nr:hypothetical protein [Gemmobacter fulvus]MDQ1848518.1 hypothetical protein [Gemmobacter fulvus]